MRVHLKWIYSLEIYYTGRLKEYCDTVDLTGGLVSMNELFLLHMYYIISARRFSFLCKA